MVEYSSPNTNKPLHLGHIRNNLLGHSISGNFIKPLVSPVIKTANYQRPWDSISGIYVGVWEKFGNWETTLKARGLKRWSILGGGNFTVRPFRAKDSQKANSVDLGSRWDGLEKEAKKRPFFGERFRNCLPIGGAKTRVC